MSKDGATRRGFVSAAGAAVLGTIIGARAAARESRGEERASSKNSLNIRDFGAVGDGKSLDSPAINRAIEG